MIAMIDSIKSLKWVDLFFYILVDSRSLANIIVQEKKLSLYTGFIIIALVSIIEIITFSLFGHETQFFFYKISYGCIFLFLILSLGVIIYSSLIDLFLQFRGLSGNVNQILNLINCSLFIYLFLLPFTYIFKVLNFAPVFFYILFFGILIVWQSLIVIQGISEFHRISFAESMLAFLFPFLLCGVVFFFSFILILIISIGFFSSI